MRALAAGAVFLVLLLVVGSVAAQEQPLESRVKEIEHRLSESNAGLVLFLCGAFCALWAQNSGRNAWQWFFLGLVCNGFAVLVLLWKNADDRAKQAGTSHESQP